MEFLLAILLMFDIIGRPKYTRNIFKEVMMEVAMMENVRILAVWTLILEL